MPRRPVWLSEPRRAAGLVVPVPVDPAGIDGPTAKQARGPHWRASSRGLHLPAHVDSTVPEQRIVEAAARMPMQGAVTGWASLRWRDARWFTGWAGDGSSPLPVTLAIPHGDLRPVDGIRISEEGMRFDDVELVDGLWLTTCLRTVLFEMRHADSVADAVIALDMATYSDLMSIVEMVAYAVAAGPVNGIIQAREALTLADENSWSPRETLFRILWELVAGRPRPWCNVPVFDLAGRHIATPDLLDPWAGVAGEYEGAVHLDSSRRSSDVRREAALRKLGLEYVTMTGSDHADPRPLVDRIDAAYGRAGRLSQTGRLWTVAKPSWWIDTSTVAARRALSPGQRARLLRYRRVG